MRILDGRYQCAHCGAILDIGPDDEPRVSIRAASGQPNVRALMLGSKEIHACEIASLPSRKSGNRTTN